jgi:hypothetical protein
MGRNSVEATNASLIFAARALPAALDGRVADFRVFLLLRAGFPAAAGFSALSGASDLAAFPVLADFLALAVFAPVLPTAADFSALPDLAGVAEPADFPDPAAFFVLCALADLAGALAESSEACLAATGTAVSNRNMQTSQPETKSRMRVGKYETLIFSL